VDEAAVGRVQLDRLSVGTRPGPEGRRAHVFDPRVPAEEGSDWAGGEGLLRRAQPVDPAGRERGDPRVEAMRREIQRLSRKAIELGGRGAGELLEREKVRAREELRVRLGLG
jgi:hypothetical protein